MWILTLQGPMPDGRNILESWEMSENDYLSMRTQLSPMSPMAVTITENGKVVSQNFYGDEES